MVSGQDIYFSGHFLVAETDQSDQNFQQSVVLLVKHDERGAFGLVINNKTEIQLGDAAGTAIPEALAKFPLYIGGPVEREFLFVLHSGFKGGNRSPDAMELAPGIVFEPSFALVSELYHEALKQQEEPEVRIHFFSGYSGWSSGQLEQELKANAWIVIPASADMVFQTAPDTNWIEGLKRKGGVHWVFAKTGYKPSMN